MQGLGWFNGRLVCAAVALLGFGTAASANEDSLVFTLTEEGEPIVLESSMDTVGSAVWKDKAQDLMRLLGSAAQGVCGFGLTPKQVALDAGVVRLSWDSKDVCRNAGMARNFWPQAWNNGHTPSAVEFQVPSRGPRVDPADVRKFVQQLGAFVCNLPVRPTDLQLNLPPARIEWSVRDICR
jgi:hypothetical protein